MATLLAHSLISLRFAWLRAPPRRVIPVKQLSLSELPTTPSLPASQRYLPGSWQVGVLEACHVMQACGRVGERERGCDGWYAFRGSCSRWQPGGFNWDNHRHSNPYEVWHFLCTGIYLVTFIWIIAPEYRRLWTSGETWGA